MRSRQHRHSCLAVVCFALLAVTAGCTDIRESTDYERHRQSRLLVTWDTPPKIFFDVRVDPRRPADDPVAEAERMAWLDAWLRQRGLCPAGHETAPGRAFDWHEDNPGHFDRRYEVRCQSDPGVAR